MEAAACRGAAHDHTEPIVDRRGTTKAASTSHSVCRVARGVDVQTGMLRVSVELGWMPLCDDSSSSYVVFQVDELKQSAGSGAGTKVWIQ